MSGVSYWVEKDSKKIKEKLENLVNKKVFEEIFWDDLVKENLEEFDIKINKIKSTDCFEIDSLRDLENAEDFLNIKAS